MLVNLKFIFCFFFSLKELEGARVLIAEMFDFKLLKTATTIDLH